MKAGELNRRIQFQAQSTTQDSFGQPLQTWGTIYECWASIDVQKSQLLYSTAEFVDKVTHRFTFRWNPSVIIQPNMRIVYVDPVKTTHTYNIEALLNTNQANVELVALAYELNGGE